MCKKILSVFLVAMMLVTVLAPATSAVYQEDFQIVSGTKISEKWFKWAYFGDSGVCAHYIDKDKDGVADPIELLTCLERGVASGEYVSSDWEGKETIEDTVFWKSLTQSQRNAIIRTLLHGYPNKTDNYGVSSANKWEKFYATKILVWEFASGARAPDDFKVYTYGPKTNATYEFENAFVANKSINDYNTDKFVAMTTGTKNGEQMFTDAFAYYKKLLAEVKNHTSKPDLNDISFGKNAKIDGNEIVFDKKGTYKIKHEMFSQFTFKSNDTSAVTVSLKGDTLTVKVLKNNVQATVTATKKNTESNYYDSDGNLTPAVMVQSGTDKQILMWGTGSLTDPVKFSMKFSAVPQYGGVGVLKANTEGLPLSGVTFGVYKTKADATNLENRLKTITTDEGGRAYYGGANPEHFELEDGAVYYLRELSTQDGYSLDDSVYPVTVEANAIKYVSNTDDVEGDFQTKVYYSEDASSTGMGKAYIQAYDDGGYREDVSFAIYDNSTDAYAGNTANAVSTGTTKGTSSAIEVGSLTADKAYYLAVTDGLRNKNVIPFKSYANAYIYIDVYSGSYVVNSAAAEFGAIGIMKSDESKNSVTYTPGLDIVLGKTTCATFGLFADPECEVLIDKATTEPYGGNVLFGVDDDGNFTLETGRTYYIKELAAPYGLTPSDVVEELKVQNKGEVTYFNWDTNNGDLTEYEINNALGSNHDYTNAGGFKIIPVSERDDVASVSVTIQAFDTDDIFESYGNYPSATFSPALNETVSFYGVAKSTGNAIKLPENSILLADTHSVSAAITWTYTDGTTNTKTISYPVVANRVVVHRVDDESGWVNYSYAGIKVYKYYEVHDELVKPIEGVTFGVYESFSDAKNETSELKEITTDANGEAYVLYSGSSGLIHPYSDENPYIYYVKELSAPDNCVVTDEIYPVIVGCVDGSFVMNKSDGSIEYVTDAVYNSTYANDEDYIKVQESATTQGGILGMQQIILTGSANLIEDETAFAPVLVENAVTPTIKITKHCVSGADGFRFKLVNVYGETLKEYDGKYYFTDYPSEDVWDVDGEEVVLTTVADENDSTVGYATLDSVTLSKIFEEYSYWSELGGYDDETPRKLFLVEENATGFMSVNIQVYDEWGSTINHCGVIDFESSLDHELEVTNEPYKGSLNIEKTVDVGSVEGWQFQVEYWEFKTIDELEAFWAQEDAAMEAGGELSEDLIAEYEPTFNAVYSTDADGKITIEDLYEGTVRITELEDQEVEGYGGYYCDGERTRMVELDWKYADQTKNSYTEKYSNIKRVFKIFKKDMYDYPLAGVEFTVYGSKEDAENGAESSVVITTNENGWAYFEGFGADVYFIKETKAPDGYELSPKIKMINNTSDTWVNTPSDEADWTVINYIYVVYTGITDLGSPIPLLAIPLVFLVGTAGWYCLKKKRKNKNLI